MLASPSKKYRVQHTHTHLHMVQKLKEHLRPHFMITLSHAERDQRALLDKAQCATRVASTFSCNSIVVTKESHRDQSGYHFHIVVEALNASRFNFVKKIRKAFPEFEGASLNVIVGKSLHALVAYAAKLDPEPFVWGEPIDWTLVHAASARAKWRTRAKQNQPVQPESTIPQSEPADTPSSFEGFREIPREQATLEQRLYFLEELLLRPRQLKPLVRLMVSTSQDCELLQQRVASLEQQLASLKEQIANTPANALNKRQKRSSSTRIREDPERLKNVE